MSSSIKNPKKEKIVISASEIGQYHYCSMSWILQRSGYKPISKKLNIGREKHLKLGDTIDNIHVNIKYSRIISRIGLIFLIIGFLFFIFEVFLYIY